MITRTTTTGGLTSEALLWTSEGLITIKELLSFYQLPAAEGDISTDLSDFEQVAVVTASGERAPITAITQAVMPTRRVVLSDGRSITAATDQALLVDRGAGSSEWVSMEDIRPSDRIVSLAAADVIAQRPQVDFRDPAEASYARFGGMVASDPLLRRTPLPALLPPLEDTARRLGFDPSGWAVDTKSGASLRIPEFFFITYEMLSHMGHLDYGDRGVPLTHRSPGEHTAEFLHGVLTSTSQTNDTHLSDHSTGDVDDLWGELRVTLPSAVLRDHVQLLFLAEGVRFEHAETEESDDVYSLVTDYSSFPRLMFGPISASDGVVPINPASLYSLGMRWAPADSTDLLLKERYPASARSELWEIVTPSGPEKFTSLVTEVTDSGNQQVCRIRIGKEDAFVAQGLVLRG